MVQGGENNASLFCSVHNALTSVFFELLTGPNKWFTYWDFGHFFAFKKIWFFFNFFVISIILTLILAFCSKYQFWGISQILQITFQSQGQFTLRVAGERKKQKFLKNVHQRLHVNYFLLKEFFFSISAVLLVYLSSLRLSSDHCCLSVIQFPSLTDQL